MGKFDLSLVKDAKALKAEEIADAMSEGLVGRLVRVQIVKKDRTENTKAQFGLKIENASPLYLNGLAVTGSQIDDAKKVAAASGLTVGPRRSIVMPANQDAIRKLGLREGIRVLAADLSGL